LEWAFRQDVILLLGQAFRQDIILHLGWALRQDFILCLGPALWGGLLEDAILSLGSAFKQDMGRMNQQPPMHQLAVLSTRWVAFFHSAPDGVHHSRFLFAADHCTFFCFFLFLAVFPGPDLTHSYNVHFPTLISIAPTLVPYLLSPTNTATLITNYPTDLAIVLTTYPTNLATLLITYPTNLTIRFWVETHKLINKFFTNV
jgi:hypothetical protein